MTNTPLRKTAAPIVPVRQKYTETLPSNYIDSEICWELLGYTMKDPVTNPAIMVKPKVLLYFISSLNSPIKPLF
jgi:hypothetical protein